MTDEEFEATEETTDAADVTVRQQSFEMDGPVELDLRSGAGRIEVRLVEEAGVHVEVRHDPSAASPWMRGVSSLLTWVGDQFGEQVGEVSPAEAVRQTRFELTGNRFVVRTPLALPLRTVPIAVTVRAPAGSHVTARTGSSNISVTGAAGRLDLNTGSGEINAERAAGTAIVHSGSGAVRLGPMLDGVRARTGTGDVEVTAVGGPSTLHTGSGDVWLGAVAGDVMARTGSSNISVTGAAGRLDLNTGSGEVNADQAAGMATVHSGSGTVRLGPMLAGLRARTGTGDVEVASVDGPATLHTGSGDVWLGAVAGDVMARTGSGDLTVADASAGQIELQTGSGAIRVGVRAGTPAEVDLSSSTGEARSELTLSGTRPESEPALRIRGRTASGTAVVSPAATAAT